MRITLQMLLGMIKWILTVVKKGLTVCIVIDIIAYIVVAYIIKWGLNK